MSERENKFNAGPEGNTNYGRLAFQNFVRDVDMRHDNIPNGYVLTATDEGEVVWMPGGGGGGAGSGTIVFQPGGTSFGNVKATWGEVVAVLATIDGQVTIQIDTQFGAATIPAGAYDLGGVTLLGSECGPRVTLTLADGVTFTGDFPILKGLKLVSNSTAPVRSVTGTETLFVCMYDASMETTSAEIISVVGGTAAANVLLSDGAELIDNAGPVIDMTGAGTVTVKMGDRTFLNVGTISGGGTSTIAVDTRSDTATPYRQLAAEFTGTWSQPVAHYNRTVVYKAAHGFSVNQVLSHDATDWILADANVANKQPAAIVTEVLDANTIAIRTEGRVYSPAHGLTVGQTYYLSATTPGAIQTNPTGYAQRVLRVTSADEYVIQFSEVDRPDYVYDRQAGGGPGIKHFGFARIDDARWLIKLQVTVAGVVTETYANQGNNPAYATLDAAWTNRATLTYTTYALLTNL